MDGVDCVRWCAVEISFVFPACKVSIGRRLFVADIFDYSEENMEYSRKLWPKIYAAIILSSKVFLEFKIFDGSSVPHPILSSCVLPICCSRRYHDMYIDSREAATPGAFLLPHEFQFQITTFCALLFLKRAMDMADKASLASKRVSNIIETMTFNVYRYISRYE